jgi:hypothetical protein
MTAELRPVPPPLRIAMNENDTSMAVASVETSAETPRPSQPDAPTAVVSSYRDYDSSPFDSGAILPVQYFGALKKQDDRIIPYKRLLMAVLEDAVRCFQANVGAANSTRRRLFLETDQWIQNDAADGPFAYVSVCETLGIDPAYLRRALMDWKVRRLAGTVRRPLVRRSPVVITHRVSSPRVRNRKPRARRSNRPAPAESR